MRAIISGLGYAVILRMKILNLRIGNRDIPIGPAFLYETLTSILLRNINSNLTLKMLSDAKSIAECYPSLENYVLAVNILRMNKKSRNLYVKEEQDLLKLLRDEIIKISKDKPNTHSLDSRPIKAANLFIMHFGNKKIVLSILKSLNIRDSNNDTVETEKLMIKQVKADIQVSNLVLKYALSLRDLFKKATNNPNWIDDNISFENAIAWHIASRKDNNNSFDFRISFDVMNRNSGSGSVSNPRLELKFVNDDSKPYEIPLNTGRTIFLRGGELQEGIVTEYKIDDFDLLIKLIRENSTLLEYYIKYT
ncbi:MAG: hypothetical protein HQK96_18560, partial [Nitrospirae bacterium]|nr:hypothetical protein [Nitrospirota bacterium]